MPTWLAACEPKREQRGCDVDDHRVSSLARDLEDLEPAELADAQLVEALRAWERVQSAAAAEQARVVQELVRRRTGRAARFVEDEVACALGATRWSGSSKVALAAALERWPVLDGALRAGTLDVRKATVVADEVVGLDPAVAEALTRDCAARGHAMTTPMLRDHIRREAFRVDPADATRRVARATTERCVRHEPGRDAMAWVSAYLPAADAVTVFSAVDALADSAATDGDDRTIDQRRADALVDLCDSVLDGVAPSVVGGTPPVTRTRRRRARVQVTVAATTLLGLDDAPGFLAGHGPVPADVARRIAADGTWRRLLTDPATGALVDLGTTRYRPGAVLEDAVVARDVTCTFPGCRRPARACDLDHVEPYRRSGVERLQTSAENLQALCRHHHQAKTDGVWSVSRDPSTGRTTWTSPAGVDHVRDAVPVAFPTRRVGRAATSREPAGVGPPPF